MKTNLKENLLLYGITDRAMICQNAMQDLHQDFDMQIQLVAKAVEKAISGGVTMIQLREKSFTQEWLIKEAKAVQKVCQKYQVPFIINDYVEIAKLIQADGVHVGQNDCDVRKAKEMLGEKAIIGATAKTVEQAQKAMDEGADYLGSGAVFGSNTKKDAIPMSHAMLDTICKSVSIPVVAIGGIHAENVSELKKIQIAGIAVIGGLFSQGDIEENAKLLKSKITDKRE